MTDGEKPQAKIRVSGRGACYIPSSEIAQLPEVKEMQKMAAQIVDRKAVSCAQKPVEIRIILPEESCSISVKLLTEIPVVMENEDFLTWE